MDAPDSGERAKRLRVYTGTREALGFNSTPSYVERLWGSEEDVGTDKYDIPMTAAEEAVWNRRSRFQAAAHERLIPAASAHEAFAGLYFENVDDGKLVVLTTGSTSTMLNDLANVDPPLTHDLVVRQTDVTDDQLGDLAGDVLVNREQYFPGTTVFAVAVHTPSRSLIVSTPEEQVDAARERIAAVSRALGDVNVTIEARDPRDMDLQDAR